MSDFKRILAEQNWTVFQFLHFMTEGTFLQYLNM